MTLKKIYKEFKDAGYCDTYEKFENDYTEITSCKEILPEELELISGGKINEKFTKTVATMLSALTLSTATIPSSSAEGHNDSESCSSNSVFSFIKRNPGKSLAIALASAGIVCGGGYVIIKGVKYCLNKDNKLVPEQNSTTSSQSRIESTSTTESPVVDNPQQTPLKTTKKTIEKVEESEPSKNLKNSEKPEELEPSKDLENSEEPKELEESEFLEDAKAGRANGFNFRKAENEEFDINKISDSIKRSGFVITEYDRESKKIVKQYSGNDIRLTYLEYLGKYTLYPLRKVPVNIARLEPPSDGKLLGDWKEIFKGRDLDGSNWYFNKEEELIFRCINLDNEDIAFVRGCKETDPRNAIYFRRIY